jgi:hypothetical protein
MLISKISLVLLASLLLAARCQLVCSNVPNAVSNSDSRTCNCDSGYLWNWIQCIIDCVNVPQSNGRAKTRTSCFCLYGYIWANGSCSLDCSKLAFAVSNLNATSCVCRSGYAWANNSCALTVNCSSIANTLGANANGSCACAVGFEWSSADLLCKATGVDCSKVSDATGNNGSRQCNCLTGFWWDGLQCQINCSNVANSTGAAAGPKTCRCEAGYVWESNRCLKFVNCSAVPNAAGNNGSAACLCLAGFEWADGNCSSAAVNCSAIPNAIIPNANGGCVCSYEYDWNGSACVSKNPNYGVDCGTFPFATGPTGEGSCNCREFYSWDERIFACVPNCSRMPFTDGWGMRFDDCGCQPGFFWNGAACQRNCSAVANAWSNTDILNCSCRQAFYYYAWNGSACVGPNETAPDCSRMSGSTGVQLEDGSCECASLWFWDSSVRLCQISCSEIANKTTPHTVVCDCIAEGKWNGSVCYGYNCDRMNGSMGYSRNGSCKCLPNFTWNGNAGQCQVSCSAIPNSNGTNSSTSCSCQANYSWNGTACIKAFDCGSIPNTVSTGPNNTCLCFT